MSFISKLKLIYKVLFVATCIGKKIVNLTIQFLYIKEISCITTGTLLK